MIVNVESEREYEVIKQARWNMLRSDIYIRDNGVCWVCNRKVELIDYDLGHLIDRCNGGQDAYDNLAVMHKKCNLTKPKHHTLEEAMKWKLTPRYLTERPMFRKISENQLPLINQPIITIKEPLLTSKQAHKINHRWKHPLTDKDLEAMKQLIIEYFANKPELCDGIVNHARSEAIRQLASTFSVDVTVIRRYLRGSGLIQTKQVIADGTEYKYFMDNLDRLTLQYNSLAPLSIKERANKMNLKPYQMMKLRYVMGERNGISQHDQHGMQVQINKILAAKSNNIDPAAIPESVQLSTSQTRQPSDSMPT